MYLQDVSHSPRFWTPVTHWLVDGGNWDGFWAWNGSGWRPMKLLLIVAYSRPDIRLNYSQCSRVVNGDTDRKPRRRLGVKMHYARVVITHYTEYSYKVVGCKLNNEHWSRKMKNLRFFNQVCEVIIFTYSWKLYTHPHAYHRNEWKC